MTAGAGPADDAVRAPRPTGRDQHTPHALLHAAVADRFPLLPRTRPPAQTLHRRIDEIRELALSASRVPGHARLSTATEVLNKAALIASDTGLTELARQLCWRQFDLFHTATPLTATTAKLALQPIVNLGRLTARRGDPARAYQIFEDTYQAVSTETATRIDGRDIDFRHFVHHTDQRHHLRRFLWAILLAEGTRALTTAGRWHDALTHLQHHHGIGRRMLDGRQAAILARCATGDLDTALDLLTSATTPEPWEHAVATCLHALCLRLANRPAATSAATMIQAYLHLEPTPEHLLFRTRLGLCLIDVMRNMPCADTSPIITRIIREAVTGADAHSARGVLSHHLCRARLTSTDKTALTRVVELSGLGCGTIPPNLLNNLMNSVKMSETQLEQTLSAGRP